MTLVWRPGFMFDADASNYIEAVEAADEAASPGIGALETNVRYAINDFVLNCKADGIWTAIRAACILAGARTRQGALVPLVGPVPDSIAFVDADYNRKAGLVGNGVNKYIDTNRSAGTSPVTADNQHISIYASTVSTAGSVEMGILPASGFQTRIINRSGVNTQWRCGDAASYTSSSAASTGFVGCSRSSPTSYTARHVGTNATVTSTSISTAPTIDYFVFALNNNGSPSSYSNARIAFYSIGEALTLALLDARVTDLIAAFGRTIP